MDTTIFLFLFCAVFLSWSNVLGQSLDENNVLLTQDEFLKTKDNSPICNVKKEIGELKGLMVNVEKKLNEMNNEFKKEMEAMEAMWKYIREEKSSKKKEKKTSNKVSANPDKNHCADALYFKGGNIIEYAKSVSERDHPEGINAITSCFWVKTRRSDWLSVLSYAVPERDNEFTIILKPNVTFLLKTKIGFSFIFYDSGVWVSDGKWHHVCITWETTDGAVQVYKDGQLSNSTTGFKPGEAIAPFGTWIIGQEQDLHGGGFSTNDAFHGSLTEVNVWNRVLNQDEVFTLAKECRPAMKGNYKAYGDFIPHGGVQKFKPSCCN